MKSFLQGDLELHMITESFPHITRSCIPKLRWVCSQAIRRPEMRVATAKAKTVIVIATSRLKADYVDDDGGDDDDDSLFRHRHHRHHQRR